MAATELLVPVPAAADYSVSAELWQRLEDEIQMVSRRIDNGDELVPDDVVNVQKLKKQVDTYVTSFNKAMRDAQGKYRKLVDSRLTELGFNKIEQFVAEKRHEQSTAQNNRISYKMESLRNLSEGLIAQTKRLKDVPVAKELLPAFTARFPKVQSGAKTNDIMDWTPYFAIMSRTVNILDTFFCDPKYEDAALLPLSSGTIRELLAYVKDGKDEHLANVQVKYKEDQGYIRVEKLRAVLVSKEDGLQRIRKILDDMKDMGSISDAAKHVRMEQAWEDISLIVRLVNSI